MFQSFPSVLKSYGVPADVRTLLLLRKSIEKGLVHTLGDLYLVLRSIVVKDPTQMGPFTQAYYDYFLSVEIGAHQTVEDAVMNAEGFKEWKSKKLKGEDVSIQEERKLVQEYLDEVHTTSFDIQRIISGKDILQKDDPNMKENGGGPAPADGIKTLEQAADYLDISVEELLERMRKVAEQQKEQHQGGSHWIGSGGISPYGNGGAAFGGIRMGGKGGGGMARKVLDDARYFPVDMDKYLNDDNMDAAIASLKGVFEESAQRKLDVDFTIKKGLEEGGIFIPYEKEIIEEKMQVLLLIDNGGYSMDPFIYNVMELFKKMKTRFAHDLEVYYFHNTIYDEVFTDEARRKRFPMDKLLSKDPNYSLFVVGDAAMSPYELGDFSLGMWQALAKKFKRSAWLNPLPERNWKYTYTIQALSQIINMYNLTPRGIEKAVREMNRKVKRLK